jgi:hypothetical protein
MKQRNIVIALLVGLLLVLGGAAMVGPNTAIFRAILVQNDAAIGNDLAVGNNITADGAMDIAGNPSYGSRDLRPVGNPANGKVYLMGVTSAKVQSATVVPTAQLVSTVTAFGCEPDDAVFSGAWDCRAAMGSTNNITFTLYEVDATPVPTGTYDEIRYWVAGN